jgi:ribosomal protein S18 acetylase RimI-like enzyme
MDVRPATADEIDQLAELWYEVWHESHAGLVPEDLTRLRTADSFRDRLRNMFSDIRVVGPSGSPVGFSVIRGSELYQLFVSPGSRGTGIAGALIDDADARLSARGVETAHLACAIGNERAARFYEKRGWRRVGTVVDLVETERGPYALKVWRYEKPLAPRLASR